VTLPLLTTKLYIPPVRPDLVPRPRLIERLNEGLRRASGVILVSAPAGFGKTTLLSAWIHQKGEGRRLDENVPPSAFIPHPSRVAWVSLDEGDNDLARFLAYLVAALQTVEASIGEDLLSTLHASPPQPPPLESNLTTMVNDIATLSEHLILVLDDVHVIRSRPVQDALAFLVDRLPPRMHLVIATRADPALPLARLRARGQMTELRQLDLRFTADEAAAFLNEVMGLGLSAADVEALEARTEGWIVGLQLAALSLRGRSDTAGFIQTFTGSQRYVLDYLVAEVLHQQPGPIQGFLLQTSVLDRLTGPLCDAVLSSGAEEEGSEGEVSVTTHWEPFG